MATKISSYQKTSRNYKNGKEKYPKWKCPRCHKQIELTFDPSIEKELWKDFRCKCNHRPHNILSTIDNETKI